MRKILVIIGAAAWLFVGVKEYQNWESLEASRHAWAQPIVYPSDDGFMVMVSNGSFVSEVPVVYPRIEIVHRGRRVQIPYQWYPGQQGHGSVKQEDIGRAVLTLINFEERP